jgi:hypothetical protein
VKSQGAAICDGSFLPCARKWSSIRFSKCVIGLTISSMQEEQTSAVGTADHDPMLDNFLDRVSDTFFQFIQRVQQHEDDMSECRADCDVQFDSEQAASTGGPFAPQSEATWEVTRNPGFAEERVSGRRMYKIYKSRAEIEELMSTGHPISFVVLSASLGGQTEPWYACAYDDTNKVTRLSRVLPSQFVVKKFGACFHSKWTVVPNGTKLNPSVNELQRCDYGLLLPMRASIEQANMLLFHAAITHSWKEVLEDGKLGFFRQEGRPSVPFAGP